MKITIFVTVALTAVVGMAFADERFNNWNNNNNNGWGNDDGGFVGMGQLGGGSFGQQSVGYNSGYGSSYGSVSGYGSGSGYGSVSGYGSGYGKGFGMAKAAYIPVPAAPKGGSSLTSILPIFFLLFLLPQLFNGSSGRDQIILLNSTLN